MDDFQRSLQAWREEMDQNLRAPYSWLALAGLHWLEPGSNKVGSGEDCPVRLPARFPTSVGEIQLEGDEASFIPNRDAPLKINEEGPLTEKRVIAPDISGKPDFVFLEDLRLALIVRDGNPAIRVWDPQQPNRASFAGRSWFEADTKWRVLAQVSEYEEPKEVLIDDIVGFQHQASMDAKLEFEIGGQEYALDAARIKSGAFEVIFKDATAGEETYPSGRYLVTEVVEGGQVYIDFNRAYNPPCAFTNYATCPLPRPENILPIRVEAGEQFSALH